MTETYQEVFRKILTSSWKEGGSSLSAAHEKLLADNGLHISVAKSETESMLMIVGRYEPAGHEDTLSIDVKIFFSNPNQDHIVKISFLDFNTTCPVRILGTTSNSGAPIRCWLNITSSTIEAILFPSRDFIERIAVENKSIVNNLGGNPNIGEMILEGSTINKLNLLGGIKYLRLGKNLVIGNIPTIDQTDNISLNNTVLDISPDFSIRENAFSRYKILGRIARVGGDRTSAHTLYVKELEEFKKLPTTDWDSWLLINIGAVLNKNGTSFLLPLFYFRSLMLRLLG